MKTISLGLIALLILQGCTTMRLVSEDQRVADVVQPGDKIELIDKAGRISSFTVDSVTTDLIAGTSSNGTQHSIAMEDIEALKVERLDENKTVLAVIAAPVLVVGVGLALLAVCGYSC